MSVCKLCTQPPSAPPPHTHITLSPCCRLTVPGLEWLQQLQAVAGWCHVHLDTPPLTLSRGALVGVNPRVKALCICVWEKGNGSRQTRCQGGCTRRVWQGLAVATKMYAWQLSHNVTPLFTVVASQWLLPQSLV